MTPTIVKRPDRLYEIHVDTAVMLGPRGRGLTFEQARLLADGLQLLNRNQVIRNALEDELCRLSGAGRMTEP